ncbi:MULTISPECIES: nucleoside-triphosphatase [unclassified Halanaerobium]|uniref:nucleoside-triphosphatase n=1 Tax=unclassified Halanaerobium TaxID=2641197 RepID=UPI000DF205DC|nr:MULTISPECIES: nucleoside-triphosphatase [unclassified Halanaerobium]RCW50688.1 nucleoside-triphosphatase [Halanaerobium sp. MA284_MarDTE_T2]RCW86856.1 nucleoside-triphosphatase [Halanaerobium sp. DL-01]
MKKINNIFLTGEKGTGKSTIIKNALLKLKITPGGFTVGREKRAAGNCTAFFLLSGRKFVEIDIKNKNENNTFAFRKDADSNFIIRPEIFETYGLELLENCKEPVLMDELGRFELKAKKFRNRIIKILKSEKVTIGVIKNEENGFLNKIRQLDNIKILRVEKENRDEVFTKFLKKLKEVLNYG